MTSAATPAVPPRTNRQRPPRQRQVGDQSVNKQTSDAIISQRIAAAQSALWRAEVSRVLLIPVVACLVALTAWAAIDQWVWSPGKFSRCIALLAGVGALALWISKRVWPLMFRKIHPDYAAYSLEHDLPELRHSLTSYVSLSHDHTREGVRGVVVRSIGVRAADQLQHHEIDIPSEATANLKWWIGVVGAIALALGFAALSPKNSFQSTKRLLLPLASIDAPSRVNILEVMPGDIEVLAGRPFDISANIVGLSKSEQARIEFSTGFTSTKPLEFEASMGVYKVSIAVESATEYRIVAGDATAGPFEISTKDVPVVSISQVEISPPAYTGLPTRSTTGGAIVGEENSIAKITAKTNRAVARARIEFNPRQIGDKYQASAGTMDMAITAEGMDLEASFPLRRALLPSSNASSVVAIESYLLHVWDAAGAENLEPIVYPVRIVNDLAPEVAITEPQRPLTEVPINGAQKIEVHALDPDYGLKLVQLQIRRGVDTLKTEVLWSSANGERGNQVCTWVLQPKSLGLVVGQTVQVVAIASDNRHDENGKLASNVVACDPISFEISAPQDNAKLPNFEKPAEQPEAQTDQATASDGGGESGDKNQSGQGGSGGKGQSGKSQQGEGQSQGGSPGSGQSENGEGSEQEQNAAGDGAAGGSKENSASQDQGAEPGGGEQSKADGQSADDGQSEDGGQSEAGGTDGAQPPGDGQAGQKPEHDGDAFERIEEFINQEKKKGQDSSDSDVNGQSTGESGDQSAGEKGSSSADSNGTESSGSESSEKPGKSEGESGQSPVQKQKQDEGKNGSEAAAEAAPAAGSSGKPEGNSKVDSETQSGKGKPEQTGDSSAAGGGDSAPNETADPATARQPSDTEKDASGSKEPAESGDQSGSGKDTDSPPESGKGKPSDTPSANESAESDPAENSDSAKGQPSAAQPADNGKSGKGKSEKDANKSAQANPEPNPQKSAPSGDDSGKSSDSAKGGTASNGSPPPTPSEPESSASYGGGEGDGSSSGQPEVVRPPDPVDVDQARKATDLVLDYLNAQREKPDPELLKRLDWTPEELRDFADRWNKVREADQKADGDGKQIEEALRSLGIRSVQNGQIGRATDTDDALRGLKDAGNRTPPPSIHRDAFDAFRKNVNRR